MLGQALVLIISRHKHSKIISFAFNKLTGMHAQNRRGLISRALMRRERVWSAHGWLERAREIYTRRCHIGTRFSTRFNKPQA